MRRTAFLLILLLLLTLGCQTAYSALGLTTPTPSNRHIVSTVEHTTPTAISPDEHQATFEIICHLVRENYVYPDYNGHDWDALCEAMAPRVAEAEDDETFYALMTELIESLGDEHSTYLSPTEAEEEDKAWVGTLDYVGVGVYVTRVDDRPYAIVLFPIKGGPAEAAGIQPRDRILEIDGTPACCNADGSDNFELMLGEEGTEVHLLVQSPGEAPREVTITRASIPMQLPTLGRRLTSDGQTIGYLLIPSLDDNSVARRTRRRLRELLTPGPLDGLILDLRGNYGGEYTQLTGILSLFTEGYGGYLLSRGGERKPLTITADPIDDSQTLPLVVLVDGETASYAEVLAGVLQYKDRAYLIGTPTEGNVETLHMHQLPDGSRLWLAEEAFFFPDGTSIEGVGLQPDLLLEADDWADYPLEEDPHILAALHHLSEGD